MSTKKFLSVLSLLLCVLLLVLTGCAKAEPVDMAALRQEYPVISNKCPETAFVMKNNYKSLLPYWDEKVTVAVELEVTGAWTSEPYTESPVGDPSVIAPVTTGILFFPAKVCQVLAGEDDNISKDMKLSIHMGGSDWISDDLINAIQPGKKFVVFLIPSIGRLSDDFAAENVYSGRVAMYVLDDDRVVSIFSVDDGDYIDNYSGRTLKQLQNALKTSYKHYKKAVANGENIYAISE